VRPQETALFLNPRGCRPWANTLPWPHLALFEKAAANFNNGVKRGTPAWLPRAATRRWGAVYPKSTGHSRQNGSRFWQRIKRVVLTSLARTFKLPVSSVCAVGFANDPIACRAVVFVPMVRLTDIGGCLRVRRGCTNLGDGEQMAIARGCSETLTTPKTSSAFGLCQWLVKVQPGGDVPGMGLYFKSEFSLFFLFIPSFQTAQRFSRCRLLMN